MDVKRATPKRLQGSFRVAAGRAVPGFWDNPYIPAPFGAGAIALFMRRRATGVAPYMAMQNDPLTGSRWQRRLGCRPPAASDPGHCCY